MKKALALAAIAVFAVSLGAAAHEGQGEHKHGSGEKLISGTIARLDMTYRAMTVTDAKNMNWLIMWNDSTRVLGAELKVGAPVQLGYVEAENKNWAAWIRVGEAKR